MSETTDPTAGERRRVVNSVKAWFARRLWCDDCLRFTFQPAHLRHGRRWWM